IESYAFANCSSLMNITIGNSVTSIGSGAFIGCPNLKTVTFHCKNIGDWFKGIKSIKEIVIGDGVKTIDYDAFLNCTGLTSVTIPNSVTSIGNNAFSGCSSLKTVIFHCKNIGNWFSGIKSIKEVIFGNEVQNIGEKAFYNCSGLTSVTIPNSVTSIGNFAFSGCTGLKSVSIPGSVEEIGASAFQGCSGLTSINIPNSVKNIGSSAFEGCSGFTNFTIPNSVTSIESLTFSRCSNLTNITIPNSVTRIGSSAFQNCSSLANLDIPNSVTTIGGKAFANCKKLTSVKLPDNIESINTDAFDSSCKLLCKEGFATLLSLWDSSISAYSFDGKELPKPYYSSNSPSQTTINITIKNYYKQYQFILYASSLGEDKILTSDYLTLTDLFPEQSVYVNIRIATVDGRKKIGLGNTNPTTKSISPNIKFEVSPTSIKPMGTYTSGDASVTSKKMYFGNNLMETNSMELTGLNPKASYGFRYEIVVTSAKGTTRTYQATKYIETSALSLKTLQPKVISSGNVIVAAETNINVDEEKVGFEWRRTDWTSDFPSNTGAAALFDGTMEGYIRNLNTDKLWKVRPYYLSNSGTYYYGDWMGVDPTNTSYFEPTVHTYAKIEVKGNTALIKGYALQGTDGVKVQGFKYWRRVSKASAEDSDKAMAKRAPNIPSNATTVTSSGQVMTAELANLGYETNYSFVAFVTTNTGETFYGEEQTFTTGANPVGIEGVEISAEEKRLNNAPKYYDMQGHQLNGPIRGLNIVRMADGTVKKVLVK
ncbi:MAG: leucine-rich repeat domain-containing protein, partial [Prevotella sp.]|nr:leucine-rich repeat domain-containing protein [Prevotella sp.]